MTHSLILSLANQKGGVGKTTTTINLSTAFAAIGLKVLIIDLDPQANATSGFGILANKNGSIYQCLVTDCQLESVIVKTTIPNLFLVPSCIDLAAAEIELHGIRNKHNTLKTKITSIKNNYDVILIDCPPSLGMLTINALTSSTGVIIPLQCEYFALEGLAHLMNTITLIKKELNHALDVEGILLTMVDKRNNLTFQVEQDVRGNFGDKVYKTYIPRNVKLSEAPSHGKPALIYDRTCLGSLAYIMLAKEIYNKHFKVNDNELKKCAG